MSTHGIQIFLDGADPRQIEAYAKDPLIQGFTTNPSLLKQAGIADYEKFARDLLKQVTLPISFEVFADDFSEMRRQALAIASWGPNVYVKIPVTNSLGESTVPLVRELSEKGVPLNITALYLPEQVAQMLEALKPTSRAYLSIFAGRIADTGRDPVPVVQACRKLVDQKQEQFKKQKGGFREVVLLWASSRQVFSLVQARETGCEIITMPRDQIQKLSNFGKDLGQVSLETVKTFKKDADAAGLKL